MDNNKIKEASFKFDANGYDVEGFDKDGFNSNGYDKEGYNSQGYNELGFDRGGFNRRGYNNEGYDKGGYNENGYDKEGFHRSGYNASGINKSGFDRNQNYRKPKPANDTLGIRYDVEGYDYRGFDPEGFNRDGINKDGDTKEQVEKREKLIEDLTLLNSTINTMKAYAKEATNTLVKEIEIDGNELNEYISKLSSFDGVTSKKRSFEELYKIKKELTETVEKYDWDKFKFSKIKDEILIKSKFYLEDLKSLSVEYKDLKVEEPSDDLSDEEKYEFCLTQLLSFYNTKSEKLKTLNNRFTFNYVKNIF